MTIRAHLDDQFDREFGGLPDIAPPVRPDYEVTELLMDGLLFGNSDFEINNPHAVGVLPYDPMTQHEAENGICVEGENDER